MRPLIDTDILRYEVGATGQYIDEDTGEAVAKNFDTVAENFDQKIEEICALVWATEEPLLFLSMDARTKKRQNKRKKRQVERLKKKYEAAPAEEQRDIMEEAKAIRKDMEYKPNFREEVAEKKEYKGNRKKSVKPLHYDNLTEYILAKYDVVMAEGLEADDLLSIYQRRALAECPDPTTIICSRDKDLRITPGMHFGWECGKQSQFGPELVSELGRLKPIFGSKVLQRGPRKGLKEVLDLKGTGLLFFGAQLIMGDPTDNIPGIPRLGTGAAWTALQDVDNVEDMFTVVKELYVDKFGDDWEDAMLERGRLLWMVAELDEKDKPIMWEIPKWLKE